MKTGRTLLKLAVLAIGLQDVGAGAASPALADIMKAFPLVSPTTIMLIASLPAISMAVFAPIYGILSAHMPKRRLLFLALGGFVGAGVAPAFLSDMYWILVMRCLLGVSIGVLLPMSVGLTADFFEGHERDTLMGWQTSVASIGGIFFQLVGGFLAARNWHYCFFAYLFGGLVLLFEVFALPEPPKRVAETVQRPKLNGAVCWVFFSFFLYNMLFFAFVTNTAVVLVGEKLGDAGAAGIALTCYTVGSLFGGFGFGRVTRALKGYTLAFGYAVSAVAFLVCLTAHSALLYFVGGVVSGLGAGIVIPGHMCRVSVTAPRQAVAFALSLAVSVIGLGGFVQPYVYDVVLTALHQPIGRFPLLLSTLGMTALGVWLAVVNFRSPNRDVACEPAS